MRRRRLADMTDAELSADIGRLRERLTTLELERARRKPVVS